MFDDQNGLSEKEIESNVLRLYLLDVTSKKQGKSCIPEQCRLNELTDSKRGRFAWRVGTSVHCSEKIPGLKSLHGFQGKSALRKNHDFIANEARLRLKTAHAHLCYAKYGIQSRGLDGGKLRIRVVTPVITDRKSFAIVLEEIDDL
jgi:hypothetical protein